MCLLLLAYKCHRKFDVIIASNRDEARSRQTLTASFWCDAPHVLGGRDVSHGGGWLAVARDGRFGAVTNIYEPAKIPGNSRGLLVKDFLLGSKSPGEYVDSLRTKIREFAPFNLVLGDQRELVYFSSPLPSAQKLSPGIYGFSNDVLGSSWPKIARGTRSLQKLTGRSKPIRIRDLFDILTSDEGTNGRPTTRTVFGDNWREELTFVPFSDFGTRSSTAILIDQIGRVTFAERVFGSDSEVLNANTFRFKINRPEMPSS
jgi:uncharacterized protein with NRDE domain